MEFGLTSFVDALALWFNTTPAKVEQTLFGALVVGFVFASVHLLTMFITRWGDRHTNAKSLLFSLLVHLSTGVGVVVFAPEPIRNLLTPSPEEELVQEIELTSDDPFISKQTGNTPVWERLNDSQPPEFARTELETMPLDQPLLPERKYDEIDYSKLETVDIRQNFKEAINVPEAMRMAEPRPDNEAARAMTIDDPFEYQPQTQKSPSPLTSRMEVEASLSPDSYERQPQAGGVDRLDLDINPQLRSLDAPLSPDSELMRQPDTLLEEIARRQAPAPAESLLPEVGESVATKTQGNNASTPATTRMSRLPTQAPNAIDESPLTRSLTNDTPSLLAPDAPSPIASLMTLSGVVPDLPSAARPEFDAIRQGNTARLPATYRLRDLTQREENAKRYGGTEASEKAVESALRWLASVQEKDGSWDGSKYGAGNVQFDSEGVDRLRAGQNADAGLTALSLLCFLGAGYTSEEGNYVDTVSRAVEWLLSQQNEQGYLGGNATKYESMYCHGMATYALAEAYSLQANSTANPRLKAAVEKATGYILAFQDKTGGGWRYVAQQEGDMSMFGWQLMGLKSAEIAGISIPGQSRSLMVKFLRERSRGDNFGLASYRLNDQITPAMTAEALFCKQMLAIKRDNPACKEAVDYLLKNLPRRVDLNLYYWYYGTLAMYQYGGEEWETWNTNLRDQLVAMQTKTGPNTGSWEPRDVWSGYGGRIYSTTLSTLSLEVYYRFLPLYRLGEAEEE